MSGAVLRDIRERGHALRFGLVTPPMWRSWDEMLDLWTRAERCGFDAAFVTDHFLSDWDGEMGSTLEAFTMMAALAREVPRLAIGVYVTGVTHRPPAVLAKQALTVDHVSGGRLILGLGAAWNEREHEAYGIPFPLPRERVDLVGETLTALRLLERNERTNFSGAHLSLRDAPFEPKPVHGHLPILMGSKGRRMQRHVARFADYWDLGAAEPEVITERATLLAAECVAAGRDPDEIVWMHEEIIPADASRDPARDPARELAERVERLSPLGVSYFLVNHWPKSAPDLVDRAGEGLAELRATRS